MDSRLRRPPKQQRSRGRVEEILAAARRLIGEKGIDAVKMREIAALAGGPISSVYQYFPNKTAILAMLYEQWVDEIEARVNERLEDVGSAEDLIEGASDLLDYYYSRIVEDNSILDLLIAVQADKTLTELDIASTRRQAERFCAVGVRFVPPERHDAFRRSAMLMFQLAFAAVRLAVVEKDHEGHALEDFKALARGQMTLLTAPVEST
jgi:AcrR family transcriptional regulator